MQLSLLSALVWLQRSFPLTEEEYLLHLDDIANTLKGWGAVSHIRSSLAKTKERPRIGKVNQFPCQIPPWNTHSILFVSIECEWGLGLLAWHLYRIRKSNRCTLCLAMHLHRAWDVVSEKVLWTCLFFQCLRGFELQIWGAMIRNLPSVTKEP